MEITKYDLEKNNLRNKKVFLFYDINQINFYKYIPGLLKSLKRDQNIEVLLCYEEELDDESILEFLSHFTNIKVGLFNSILSVFKKYQVDLVVVNAQRIPDSLCISFANKNHIPTLMIQHGMYNGHLKRKNDLYIRKLYKTFKYFLYSLMIGRICKRNQFLTLIKFILTFSFRKSYAKYFSGYSELYAKNIHVYGSYWIDYHKKFFGYDEKLSSFNIVGYPELVGRFEEKKVDFCYIAQSLFEDGRSSQRELSAVLKILAKINQTHSLVIKRHPRSFDKIYEDYGLQTSNTLPDAEVFIGHYSSLLAMPIAAGKKVALIPLDGHDIPNYFKRCAYESKNSNDLIDILSKHSKSNKINEVFEFPIKHDDHLHLLLSIIENDKSI